MISIQPSTLKEHDGYTALVSCVWTTDDGIPYRTLLRYRHVGFKARRHAARNALAMSRNLLAYSLGDIELFASLNLHWESTGRNCITVHSGGVKA